MNLNQENLQFNSELQAEYGNLTQALSEIEQLPSEILKDPVIRNTFNEGLSRKQELEKVLNFSQPQGDNSEVS